MSIISDSYFLGILARANPNQKIEISVQDDMIILSAFGVTYKDCTLGECIDLVKESFVHKWISKIHEENNSACVPAVEEHDRCRFCGNPIAKGFNICMGCHLETR